MPYLNTRDVGHRISRLKMDPASHLVLYSLLHCSLDEMEMFEDEDEMMPEEPEEYGWRITASIEHLLTSIDLPAHEVLDSFQAFVDGKLLIVDFEPRRSYQSILPTRIMFFPDIQRRQLPVVTQPVAVESVPQPAPQPIVSGRPGYVYLLGTEHGHYKIGRTNNPEARQKQLGILLPFTVQLVCLLATQDMVATERQLHDRFRHRHLNGEWFALTDEERDEIIAMAAK